MDTTNKKILEGRFEGKQVTVKGWVQTSRSHGKLHFLEIRDGTGVLQATARLGELNDELFQAISNLGEESSVIIEGLVAQDKRAPGGYEIKISDVKVRQTVRDYPLAKIEKKNPDKEYLRDHRHLWIRDPKQSAILKIRGEVIDASRRYLTENGFIEITPPMFTGTACEEISTLFTTNYFGKTATLTQSGQLYLEAAMYAYGKVFGVDPSFRAEKSRTMRHLTEFWQIEPEAAFLDFEGDMKLAEDLVSHVAQEILKNRLHELKLLGRDISKLKNITPPFPRVSYDEALNILEREGFKVQWGDNFGTEHERVISLKYDKPVLVHRYPAKTKAFYMQPDPQRPEVALCFDMLAPEGYGEIIGGSQRIHDLDLLISKIKEYGLNAEDYEWYIDLRRYGTVEHSGFGMGSERYAWWFGGLEDVQETIPFARTTRRLNP